MDRKRLSLLSLPLAFAILAMPAGEPAAAGGRHWLITPEEAIQAGRAIPGQPTVPMAAEQSAVNGPQILIKKPELLERVRSPVNMLVDFLPGASGLAPDTSTLTVTLRGFITVDITDRLREYLHQDELDVEGADLPTGTFRIRLALADTGGNLTVRDLTLVVADQEEIGGR